jgi:hypothetical protein
MTHPWGINVVILVLSQFVYRHNIHQIIWRGHIRIVIAVSKSFVSFVTFIRFDGWETFKIRVGLVWRKALMTWTVQLCKRMQNSVSLLLWLLGSLIIMTFTSSENVAAMRLS